MTKRKQPVRICVKEDYPRHLADVVDMELNCVTCGRRLYVSEAVIDAVLASLERVGAALLICAECNQVQLVQCRASRSRGLHA